MWTEDDDEIFWQITTTTDVIHFDAFVTKHLWQMKQF